MVWFLFPEAEQYEFMRVLDPAAVIAYEFDERLGRCDVVGFGVRLHGVVDGSDVDTVKLGGEDRHSGRGTGTTFDIRFDWRRCFFGFDAPGFQEFLEPTLYIADGGDLLVGNGWREPFDQGGVELVGEVSVWWIREFLQQTFHCDDVVTADHTSLYCMVAE